MTPTETTSTVTPTISIVASGSHTEMLCDAGSKVPVPGFVNRCEKNCGFTEAELDIPCVDDPDHKNRKFCTCEGVTGCQK